jgi:hypothetical protein
MNHELASNGSAEPSVETVRHWCSAGEAGDIDLAMRSIATNVVLRSPLTDRLRFEGRDQVRQVLEAAYDSIDQMRFHTVVGQASIWGLFYTARVGTTPIEEAQLVRLDDHHKIVEVSLMIRPLTGLAAVMAALGPRMIRKQGHSSIVAAAVSLTIKPLTLLARVGDFAGARLLQPRPRRARSGRRGG